MYAHQTTIEVRWGDMDAYGHVNNTVFFRYFEMARFRYFEALDLCEDGVIPTIVLAAIECQFKRALVYPATIVVHTRVLDLGSSSLKMQAIIECEGELCAQATATMVWVDSQTHKPQKIPMQAREKIRAHERLDARTD